MNRKLVATVLCLILALTACTAWAGTMPTSQFAYTGWYYVATAPCRAQATPTAAVNGSSGSTCTGSACATKTPCVGSACATKTPCVGSSCATKTTCPAASVTPKPTSKPTVKPTAAPTAKVTAKPTQTPKAPDNYTSVSVSAQEQQAAKLLNQDRTSNGLSALTLDPELCRLARLKSTDMYTNNYFAHTSPTYGSAGDLLRSNGYSFSGWGENIAHHANVTKAEAAFMSSTGHRANILGSQWTKFGIGICFDSNGFIYETQIFVR